MVDGVEWITSKKDQTEAWERVFSGEMLPKNLQKPILHAAWRITRAIAEVHGAIDHYDRLTEIPRGSEDLSQLLLEGPVSDPGPSLVPLSDPERLVAVTRHLNVLIGLGSLPQGASAMRLLTDPDRVAEVWPSMREIIRHENEILVTGVEKLTRDGYSGLKKYFRDVLGLCYEECRVLESLVRQECKRAIPFEKEVDRSVMVLRLEGVIERAQENLDLRSEIMALNRMAQIQGLYETNQNTDVEVEFTEYVQSVTGRIEDGDDEGS